MRADARENRSAILEAARAALESTGDVSLNGVAKAAGVGNATLYRHFPTREALILGVYREVVEDVASSAGRLLEAHPPPEALRAWIWRVAEYAIAKKGFAQAVQVISRDEGPLYNETYRSIVDALTSILDAGALDGSLRHDVYGDDVILALAGLWQLPMDERWRQRTESLVDIVVAGLRTR